MTSFPLSRSVAAVVLGVALCTGASAQLLGSFGFGANGFDTTRGYMMGRRGNPQTGYDAWLPFFQAQLLGRPSQAGN